MNEVHFMDDETPRCVTIYFKRSDTTHHLVPPNVYHRNTIEYAIST